MMFRIALVDCGGRIIAWFGPELTEDVANAFACVTNQTLKSGTFSPMFHAVPSLNGRYFFLTPDGKTAEDIAHKYL